MMSSPRSLSRSLSSFVLLVSLVLLLLAHDATAKFGICLSVIVRDEERVIERFLTNNRYSFDHIDIVDTGSSDRTIERAEAHFRKYNVSGLIHHFTWIDDFGAARSYALEMSRRQQCEFITFLDADEEVIFADTRQLLQSEADKERLRYLLRINCAGPCQLTTFVAGNLQWWRFFAINADDRDVYWRGSRHEYLTNSTHHVVNVPVFGVYARRDQSRLSRAPDALLKDIAALERDAEKGEDLQRTLYYIGQSYEQAGIKAKALDAYARRAAIKEGWDQERFYAQYRVAGLTKDLYGFNKSVHEYLKAVAIDRSRAEPLYELARGYRLEENYAACWLFAIEGTEKEVLNNHLFVWSLVYDELIHDEAAICGSYLPEHREEALEIAERLAFKHPDSEYYKNHFKWLKDSVERQQTLDFHVSKRAPRKSSIEIPIE